MRILISGNAGQLARSLAAAESSRAHELIFTARPETNLSEPGSFASAIASISPDLVINAAAYTAVDKAEEEESLAYRINAEAAGEGAKAATALGIPFVQISTDYVFNGENDRPWRECDPTGPVNAYGRTKLAGEELVRTATEDHVILRTSWVMSPFGNNFARTMLRLADKRDVVGVVDDQIGSPTNAIDLAEALIRLAPRIIAGEARGTYHLANLGEVSWADIAQVIFDAAGADVRVERIATTDFPTAAARPSYSVLDCAKARDELGLSLRGWLDACENLVRHGGQA